MISICLITGLLLFGAFVGALALVAFRSLRGGSEAGLMRCPRSSKFYRQNLIVASAARPRVVLIEDFLSSGECEQLRTLADGKYQRSTVTAQQAIDPDRTSRTAHLTERDGPLVQAVRQRAAAICEVPVSHVEPLQVVRYEPGQFYKAHYDYFAPDENVTGQRGQTIFAYLNDLQGEGHTRFEKAGINIEPKRGRAVWWYNLHEDGTADANTLHAGTPPSRGTKYGMNIFVRQQPFR